jgi:NADPH2:quinone reductase
MQRQFITIESPDSLVLAKDTIAHPQPHEIQIDVAFAGVNRADLLQRIGLYPPPEDASPIMGLEVSGTVSKLGDQVEGIALGERVCALCHGGGYATRVNVDAGHVLSIPDTIDLDIAAALPEALLTVWANVFERGALQPDETVLIHGGASGIGSIGIQMAQALGHRVLSTAGGAEKCSRVEALGAAFCANYQSENLLEQFQERGYAGQIDVILDVAGGDFVDLNFDLAAVDGRVVCIGMMRGGEATIGIGKVFMKRLTLTGSTLRRMSHQDKRDSFNAIRARVMPEVAAGRIKGLIAETFPLEKALEAHTTMQKGQHIGKIVLEMPKES